MSKYDDFREINTVWSWLSDPATGEISFDEYKCGHMIAGDTDSCMMSMDAINDALEESERNEDNFVAIADAIGTNVNACFAAIAKEAFNCPDDRLSSIAADREFVSDKSLFLSKKRYIAHVVNDEGKQVDKMKIMGVEIIRSDTSLITRKFLRRAVDMILDDCSRDEVMDAIDVMRDEFMSAPLMEIATPMSCKTLIKGIKQVRETGTMKGLHYSVRAALFYNNECTEADQPVRAGDKIGLLYIKDDRSKYIAYPQELNDIPDWFGRYTIDKKLMWDKSKAKITKYLESLGWDAKSMRENKRKSLFGF